MIFVAAQDASNVLRFAQAYAQGVQGTQLRGPWMVDRTTQVAEIPRDLPVGSDGTAPVVGAAGIPGSTLADTRATTVRHAANGNVAGLAGTDQTLLHDPAQVALSTHAGGAITAALVVKTSRPRTSAAVTISATANGQTRSVLLTVTR